MITPEHSRSMPEHTGASPEVRRSTPGTSRSTPEHFPKYAGAHPEYPGARRSTPEHAGALIVAPPGGENWNYLNHLAGKSNTLNIQSAISRVLLVLPTSFLYLRIPLFVFLLLSHPIWQYHLYLAVYIQESASSLLLT